MGKSSKHRPDNVYRFVSFSERISDINIDVIHRIRRVDDGVGETGTHFGIALRKWTDLDLTEHFTDFRKEISHQVRTYEQLIYHKEEIISALQTHLVVPASLAYPALLDLVVQLAQDMQQDFLPYLQPFFSILLAKLSKEKQHIEVLEGTFHCIAFLFKLLWKFLIKDFKQVFSYYQQLLTSSQKEYIQVFAAESCAYLLRKVKKRNELLNFFFSSLKTNPELTDGIGLLLFEMIKGVQSHFHSVADEVFPSILHKLGPWNPSGKKSNFPRVAVEKAVTVMMQECAEHTTKENSKQLWNLLLTCTSQVHAACLDIEGQEDGTKDAKPYVKHLCRLLKMISLWISHGNGKIVAEPENIAKSLSTILKSPCLPEILCPDLLACVSNLLTVCSERLSMEYTVKTVSGAFSTPCSIQDLHTFVMTLIDTPFFEKDVLSNCMTKINLELADGTRQTEEELLAFVCQLLLRKTRSPITGNDLELLDTYPLDRSTRSRSSKIQNNFKRCLDRTLQNMSVGEDGVVANLGWIWAAVVCLPHMSMENCSSKLRDVWSKLLSSLKLSHQACTVYVMGEVMKSLIRSMGLEEPLPVDVEDIFDVLRLDPSSLSALQLADFYLSHPKHESCLTDDRLVEMYRILENQLVSPSHNVRLLTCHILSLFPVKLMSYDDEISRESLFKTMYNAESIEPTLHNYREKLLQLQKLRYGFALKCLPQESFKTAPLMFLLGNEFWNFKLLWPPLADVISSYAVGMETNTFWGVMLKELHRAAAGAKKELEVDNSRDSGLPQDPQQSSPLMSLLRSTEFEFTDESRDPSFSMYRTQLWKVMKKFPEKCVLRSDDLCNLYLDFLKNEFFAADEDMRSYQSIVLTETGNQEKTSSSNTSMTVAKNEDMEVDDDNDDDDKEEQGVGKSRRKAAILSLLIHLDLFGLFKKQRSKMNTPDVQKTFFDLLMHRQGAVQKAAFECVLSYRSPHITTYKENFNRLLDDKKFKEEITLFRVDEESSQIKEEDRQELMPVLMRILFGKMRGKAGKETAGKSKSDLRRSIIFRFLGGCKSDELKFFLELLFQPCAKFLAGDPLEMVKETLASVDLKRMIPLKKIKGVLNTMSMVTTKLGHRVEGFGSSNLSILLGLAATLNSVLDQRHLIAPGFINLVKNLRHTVMNRITQFFECYEDVELSDNQLLAVFEAIVWPYAKKLEYEGLQHPTPLLKLFMCWSKNKRFLPLLGHERPSGDANTDGKESPLSCMFSLLNADTVASSVASAILDIVSQLILTEDEWDLDEQPSLSLPEAFTFSDEAIEEMGMGPFLLRPHVPRVLTFLQTTLKKMSKSGANKKLNLTNELKILSRISGFITSPEECLSLCNLLVPYLSRSSGLSEEIEVSTLQSLNSLIAYVEDPFSFYRVTCQLFTTIERRESRSLLVKLFKTMNAKRSNLQQVAEIIANLNSWDRTKAEEPNYGVRLEAFQSVNSLVVAMEKVDDQMLLPVLYNCCYFIRAVDDLSIRDNSTFCIISMVKKLAQVDGNSHSTHGFHTLVSECLVRMVKAGIKHKAEVVRHEFLAILQCLVNTFPQCPMFVGLEQICDKDPEADFFENIRHIQMHKKSRALRRLYRHLYAHTMRTELHLSYFIPLCHTFVVDLGYAKHANVQDAAIDVLSAICKHLPWGAYYHLLQFYLKLLPKRTEIQRQIIRIIVALLTGFHFDLTNSRFNDMVMPKLSSDGETKNSDGSKEADSQSVPEGDDVATVLASDKKDGDDNDVTKDPEGKKEDEADAKDEGVEDLDELPMEDEMEVEGDGDGEGSQTESMDVSVSSSQVQGKKAMTLCPEPLATKIHKMTVSFLLPKLHAVITERAKSDTEHKLVKSKFPEDTEILRVPIALAMIKLLQNLPKKTMENRLPGIFLKICYFLRSRSRDIRTTARETLEKATLSLGARYFPFVLRELRTSLTRGYQLHVLNFTTHYLLKSIVEHVTPGDLDPAIGSVQVIFHSELFGQVAEEKEVKAIKAKFFEAKFIKGYEAYQLLSRSILPNSLNQLINPVKEVLLTTHSKRIANKADILLRKVADGLLYNPAIPLTAMMIFINSLTVKLMPDLQQLLLPSKSAEEEAVNAQQNQRVPDSCLLLEKPPPPRGGYKPKANKKTNVHVLVEFGLQLLYLSLKRSTLVPTEEIHLQMLDPLIPAIRDSLMDSHEKTNSGGMRCLSWLLKFPLPSLRENIDKIVQGMFLVLRSHAHTAVSKGDSLELVTMCFKAVTVLVKEVDYYKITTDQLHVLLTYCEEDLYNYARQSTAFSLIKAILFRKLNSPQLHEVIVKVFSMSITAQTPNTRKDSRQVILFYLMNYPHGQKLKEHLYFYIDHLQYELEEGRVSALEMMIEIFSAFPLQTLHEHCHKFFMALAMASYNDASTKCRKLVIVALKMLLGKIAEKVRREIFKEVMKWLNSDNLHVRAMGCQICGLFVEVEGGKFSFHQYKVLPLVRLKLDPDLYTMEEDNPNLEDQDVCLLATVNTLLKIVRELSVVRMKRFAKDIDLLWGYLSTHLLYPHIQVRLATCQLLGLMFSAWEPSQVADICRKSKSQSASEAEPLLDVSREQDASMHEGQAEEGEEEESVAKQIEKKLKKHKRQRKRKGGKEAETMQELKDEEEEEEEKDALRGEAGGKEGSEEGATGKVTVNGAPVVNAAKNEKQEECFLANDPQEKVKLFAKTLCKQLQTANLIDPLATQIVKNFLYLARLCEALHDADLLTWLAKRVVKEANLEVIYNVKTTTRRNYTFKWVAAMSVSLSPPSVERLLPVVLPSLQRQLAEDAKDDDLKTLAQEVVDLLKKKVGVETFTKAFITSQSARLAKREDRKRQMAEEAVVDPVAAARKKLKNNLKKRDAKKRKMEVRRPTKRVKKSKLSILNVKVEED